MRDRGIKKKIKNYFPFASLLIGVFGFVNFLYILQAVGQNFSYSYVFVTTIVIPPLGLALGIIPLFTKTKFAVISYLGIIMCLVALTLIWGAYFLVAYGNV